MLFDEASHSLGPHNDKAFIQTIRRLKGKRTIIMTTHREDHMRLADILLVMNKGELVHAGNPTQILSAMQHR